MALWRDVRHAVRVLFRHRGTALLATACMALGIGIVTTMFASADPWLFRPLPYAAPERLVVVREVSPRGRTTMMSAPLVAECAEERAALASTGAYVRAAYNLSTDEEPERVLGTAMSASLAEVLGVAPVAGRSFTADEDRPSGPRVCVIGYELARRRFGGAPAALGRTLRLDAHLHTVVGVMPPGWAFPEYAEVWTPLRLAPGDRDRRDRRIDVVARLRDGVSVPQAADRLALVARRAAALDPEASGGWTLHVQSVADAQTPPGVRAALHLMLAAAVLVLLIACANVANLLLALALERRREVATRLALGATPRQLLRQVTVESLVLATAGGLAGLALAAWATDAMTALTIRPPFWAEPGLTWRAALVTAAAGVVAALVSSILPALASLRSDLRAALHENGRTMSDGPRTRRIATGVAGVELALSVVLLTAALLLARSYSNRQSLDPGFDAANALTTHASLTGDRYRSPVEREAFLRAVVAGAVAEPGIETAAAVTSLPFTDPTGGGYSVRPFEIEGDPRPPNRQPLAVVNAGTASMLAALGIPLASGRALLETDVETASPVAVVNRQMAERFWRGDAIGRRVRLGDGQWLTVVGVAGDVREPASMLGNVQRPEWQVYVPYTLDPALELTIVLRGPAAERSAAALRGIMRARDPQVPLYDVLPLAEARRRADWLARLWGRLLLVGAMAGSVLACAGVYGVVARAVARRRQEFGVRMALGAVGWQVIAMVMAGGLRLALGGVLAGALGALALMRMLSSLLYGVSPWDPIVFGSSTLALFVLALLATYLPARRATRIDPCQALRAE
jgi:predicted permease